MKCISISIERPCCLVFTNIVDYFTKNENELIQLNCIFELLELTVFHSSNCYAIPCIILYLILLSFCFPYYSHIPKAKATAIADTPELKRIAENTKIQSNVKYHADFEKQKGKLTQVRF